LSKFIGKNQDLSTITTAEAQSCGKDLASFTILGEINMEVNTLKPVTVVSHSRCNCWAVRIDAAG
jgi:hypothetical protein